MEKIELSHAEMIFLSDLLGSTQTDIADEMEETQGDLELDNLRLEMSQDLALCDSVRLKLEKAMNE